MELSYVAFFPPTLSPAVMLSTKTTDWWGLEESIFEINILLMGAHRRIIRPRISYYNIGKSAMVC